MKEGTWILRKDGLLELSTVLPGEGINVVLGVTFIVSGNDVEIIYTVDGQRVASDTVLRWDASREWHRLCSEGFLPQSRQPGHVVDPRPASNLEIFLGG